MRKIPIMLIGITSIFVSLCVCARAQQESYTAIAAAPNSTASQIRFNVRITKWSSDDELKQYGQILKDQGQDALVDALKKLDAGRINKVGDTGNQIALAQKMTSDKGTVITIVTARVMSTLELDRKAAHTKYPLGYLMLMVNDKGEGTGRLISAAKIKFDQEAGHFKLDAYGNGFVPVTNVTRNQ